jgi:hypothetical protein
MFLPRIECDATKLHLAVVVIFDAGTQRNIGIQYILQRHYDYYNFNVYKNIKIISIFFYQLIFISVVWGISPIIVWTRVTPLICSVMVIIFFPFSIFVDLDLITVFAGICIN